MTLLSSMAQREHLDVAERENSHMPFHGGTGRVGLRPAMV